jgi:hypothetical protein
MDNQESRMHAPDRTLVLEKIDPNGKSTGMVDPALLTGENQIIAKMEPESTFWYFTYGRGNLPEPLKQKFTSFGALRKHAETYFKGRNLRIKEVKQG